MGTGKLKSPEWGGGRLWEPPEIRNVTFYFDILRASPGGSVNTICSESMDAPVNKKKNVF